MIEKEVQFVDIGSYDTLSVNGKRISVHNGLALHCAGLKIERTFKSPNPTSEIIFRVVAIQSPVTLNLYDGLVDRHTVYKLEPQ